MEQQQQLNWKTLDDGEAIKARSTTIPTCTYVTGSRTALYILVKQQKPRELLSLLGLCAYVRLYIVHDRGNL